MDYFGQFGNSRQNALAVLVPFVERMLIAHHQADYTAFMSLATLTFKQSVSPASFFRAHQQFDPTLGKPLKLRFIRSFSHKNNPVLEFSVQYQLAKHDIKVHVEFCNNTMPPKINYLSIE